VQQLARYLLSCLVLAYSIPGTAQHTLDFTIPPCPTLSLTENVFPEARIRVFPNPVRDQVTVEFGNAGEQAAADIFIYNVLGKLVKKMGIPQPAIRETIDLGALPPGLYVFRIVWGEAMLNKKIIIEPHAD
jgi:hypothetical protein